MRKSGRAAPWLAWRLALAVGCGCTPPPPAHGPNERPGAPENAPAARGEPYAVHATTSSPQPAAPAEDSLARACPERDAALDRAAAFAARRELAGRTLDAEDVTGVLRAEGAPYVWPHVWTLSGSSVAAAAGERFTAWLGELPRAGVTRCGTGLARANGREVALGIAVDVVAELDALPTEVRLGTWLDVTARLRVPTASAEVIVLGPRGKPHAVTSSLDRGVVRARVRADREGAWLVQVLATVAGGPRPVAEALVFAGESPKTLLTAQPAPGEESATDDPRAAIVRMVNAARRSEAKRELRRDERLEPIAQAHAESMQRAGRLAHDVGDGSPGDRVTAAGLAVRAVGENVAHAVDARHAHRSLWRSPSHRGNVLEETFDALGVGVARDADGTLWVCELFASTSPP